MDYNCRQEEKMFTSEYLMKTKASPKKIWQLWADVENWHEWDNSVEFSNIDGKFENGARRVLKTAGGPKSKFCLENVVVEKSFTSRTKLPLCTMDFVHELVNDDGLKIKHCIKIYGPLTFVFQNIIGKNAAKNLPTAVKKLVDLAEK
jgi:hypothetical protein